MGTFPPMPGSADAVFAAWLKRRGDPEADSFDSLLQAHPKHTVPLCVLHEQWQRLEPLLRLAGFDLSAPASFAERLRAAHGPDADPGVWLDAPSSDLGKASSELLKRLGKKSTGSRYRLEGEVARGGMGAILRVWDEDIRRHLAMKVVLGKGEATSEGGTPVVEPSQLARFLEEAQVTGQLDHPGIVPVHELGLDQDGRVFFTMKLVKGRDLKSIYDLVFEGKEGWNETRALTVLLKVCEAVAYAHKKGVIHRDLKPANVMVGDFGEVYVMDWGLARVVGRKDPHDIRIAPEAGSSRSVRTERREEREGTPDSPIVTMDGDVVGTPAYMSIEQARGELEKLDARSDVYAIGAMLYHLLARQIPFTNPDERASNRTVYARLLDGPPKSIRSLRAGIAAELEAICEKAMDRDRSQRYADTVTLADDLRAYLERRVVRAYETGAFAETKKWVTRNKPLATSLASALCIAITASVLIGIKNLQLESAGHALARESARIENDVSTLSSIQRLRDLEKRADSLWPAEPHMLPAFDQWIADARAIIDGRVTSAKGHTRRELGLNDHRQRLDALRSRGQSLRVTIGEAKPFSDLATDVAYEFSEDDDRWWHATLSTLVEDLVAFAGGASGSFSDGVSSDRGWGILKRRDFANTIEDSSISGPRVSALWQETIKDLAASTLYRHLIIPPQLGLVPIGRDPDSGLYEFSHLQTGEVAQRDTEGRLEMRPGHGLVFVLIPGTAFTLTLEKRHGRGEVSVHSGILAPYFISKFEMTQAQWIRATGSNPSRYQIKSVYYGRECGETNPVESVSGTECLSVMSHFGLALPTEAQWDCAMRGGSSTRWWTGETKETLYGAANICDRSGMGYFHPREQDAPDDLDNVDCDSSHDDGNAIHAPVGSFRANSFGLHDVIGNVAEWCSDFHGDVRVPPREGDGLRVTDDSPMRVIRGGSFLSGAEYALGRPGATPDHRFETCGLRPVRAVIY